MKVFPRKVSSGGRYLVPHRNGGFVSHKNLKKEGLGISEKMYDRDTNKRHPLKSLAEDREFLSVKPPKSKKYISLNL